MVNGKPLKASRYLSHWNNVNRVLNPAWMDLEALCFRLLRPCKLFGLRPLLCGLRNVAGLDGTGIGTTRLGRYNVRHGPESFQGWLFAPVCVSPLAGALLLSGGDIPHREANPTAACSECNEDDTRIANDCDS